MSQTGYTPIQLYYSTTASAAPTSGNLLAGELAINTLDEKLYFKNSAGTVKLLASSAATNLSAPPPIGNTTPSTGAFTTLSASTSAAVNHTGSLSSALQTGDQSTPANNTGIYLRSTGLGQISCASGGSIAFYTNGLATGEVGRFTATGLSVTGTLSSTGTATVGLGGTSAQQDIVLANGSSASGYGPQVRFYRNSVYKGAVGSQSGIVGDNSDNLYINAASGASCVVGVNGSTIGTFSSTGLSVTGALSSSGAITSSTGTTSQTYLQAVNSGGQTLIGTENSTAGTLASGSSSYAGLVGTFSNTPLQVVTNGTVRATLDTSGNLGLGVTPSAWETGSAIQLGTTAATSFGYSKRGVLQNAYYDGTNFRYYGTAGSTMYQPFSGAHAWYNAPSGTAGNAITFTQAMTLDASGNLLVGRTARLANERVVFEAAGTSGVNTNGILINYTGAPNGTGNEFLQCTDGGFATTRASIRSNGGLANFSANNVNLSDARTKTDIQDAPSYLNRICAIPVRTFLYKDQTDSQLNLGAIAQEVEAVCPELVDNSGFGETPADGVPLKAIYQTDLQYALMKCIQEQQAQIESLTARLAAAGL